MILSQSSYFSTGETAAGRGCATARQRLQRPPPQCLTDDYFLDDKQAWTRAVRSARDEK
jgi:hypothetical protein